MNCITHFFSILFNFLRKATAIVLNEGSETSNIIRSIKYVGFYLIHTHRYSSHMRFNFSLTFIYVYNIDDSSKYIKKKTFL